MRKYVVPSMITALIFSSGLLPSSAFALVCDGKPVNGVCVPPHLAHDKCPTNAPRGCWPMPSVDPVTGDHSSPVPKPKVRTKQSMPSGDDVPGPRNAPAGAAAQSTQRVAKFKAGKALADTVKRTAPNSDTHDSGDADATEQAMGDPLPGIGITVNQGDGAAKTKR